jgi:hypothetical protein
MREEYYPDKKAKLDQAAEPKPPHDTTAITNVIDDASDLTDSDSVCYDRFTMLDQTAGRRPIPFYQSYAVFYRAMKALKEHGIPTRVDTRRLEPYIGDEAGRVAAGLASLGWIDEIGRPTNDFKNLVAAFGTEKWSAALAELVPRTYSYLPPGLENITTTQLKDAFIAYAGRDSGAIRNAETFYLCLASEAGFQLSDSFYRRAARAIGDAKRTILDDSADGPANTATPTVATTPVSAVAKEAAQRGSGTGQRDSAHSLTFWDGLILKLTPLVDAKDMTETERSGLFALLGYSVRQRSRAKE